MKTTKKLAYIKQKFHEGKNNVNAYIRFKVTALSLFGSAVKKNPMNRTIVQYLYPHHA